MGTRHSLNEDLSSNRSPEVAGICIDDLEIFARSRLAEIASAIIAASEPVTEASSTTSASTSQQSSTLRCVTCRCDFESTDAFHAHFRSDWHRLNLKLKLAGVDTVPQAEHARLTTSGEIDESDDDAGEESSSDDVDDIAQQMTEAANTSNDSAAAAKGDEVLLCCDSESLAYRDAREDAIVARCL
jgi:hypothetical protein